jgi:glycosyltransferase involved in cell wall biosynthesis
MWRAIASRLASRAYDVAHLFGGIQVFEFREIVRRLPCLIAPYESHSLFLSRALRDARTFAERARTAAALVVARRYERVIFRGYDRVVVVADADREALSRLSPGLRVCVIPNGVQVDAGVSASRSRPAATLVFVGNYAYVPNQRAALALVTGVLPRVKAQVPEAQLLLVGAAPPAALQRLARADVEVTGQVPDVRPYLARATCFVAPMTQGAGLKNKVLEAMAAGVPVVTTPLGAGGLAVRDGEHLLIGGDAVGLAQAVVRLLRDPSLQHRLGTAGQQLVRERYSWAEAAARYEALYRETIAEREARR